jgi:hypothetical protein
MIASVELAGDVALFTTNPDDFAGLGDLLTIVPVTRPAVPYERCGHRRAGNVPGALGQPASRVTSMLPRVALEYGQTWCAASVSERTCSGSAPGMVTRSLTASP